MSIIIGPAFQKVAPSCFVCMEQLPDAVLLECGHAGLCSACASILWNGGRQCPLCRQTFAGVMRVVEASGDLVRLCHIFIRLSFGEYLF
jgi:hypothetical protein